MTATKPRPAKKDAASEAELVLPSVPAPFVALHRDTFATVLRELAEARAERDAAHAALRAPVVTLETGLAGAAPELDFVELHSRRDDLWFYIQMATLFLCVLVLGTVALS